MKLWRMLRLLWALAEDVDRVLHDLQHLRLLLDGGLMKYNERLTTAELNGSEVFSRTGKHRKDLDAQHERLEGFRHELKVINEKLAHLGAEKEKG